ncbi:hypothetical protein HMPREF9436_01464 [Faecalibacterium cf. prausnitzii KLE1255]|uniref:Uncharacterized protein n=1 Tax=Faecalibacterium cf. prausnitzii KLE1255 TaxID=748224 RepID=E2ZIH0_9FIRM|nr:hypothetical protein HMPREF9436_01464 [Faecalibacterium cf. prausnitzii KLE1255]
MLPAPFRHTPGLFSGAGYLQEGQGIKRPRGALQARGIKKPPGRSERQDITKKPG